MNGVMTKAVSAACLAGALAAMQGCHHMDEVVDPCYPERYGSMARQCVRDIFGAQTHNGHVLDQTLWNHHFEPGTDRLTLGGMDHLAYLARRRPHPDPMVYVQTAYDGAAYDAGAPAKYAEARGALDTRRVQAVKTYLDAQTSGRGVAFDVLVHDPGEVGMAAGRQGLSIQQMHAGSRGVMLITAGGGGGGGGGGAGGGGGGR